MKKLLVLMMVLGLVTSAQAAISLSLNGNPAPDEVTLTVSDVVTIDVQSDTTLAYTAFLWLTTPTTGEWYDDTTVIYAAAGSIAEIGGPDFGGYLDYWRLVGAGTSPNIPQPGTHFEIDYHCLGVGDAEILLLGDDEYTVLDSIIIHQMDVPEPITIGLLGLGGLLLRRRK